MNHPVSQPRPFAALALILIHLVISIVHGTAHQGAMVALSAFGNVYVLVVITLAPLVAAVLLFTRKQKLGALLLALAMFGSFIFGFWYHFLSSTNDNVSEVHGPWHSTFLWTAIALAAIELAGTFLGMRIYRSKSSLTPIVDP
jgi:cation transport ATPase